MEYAPSSRGPCRTRMTLIPVYRGLTVALGPALRLYLGHRLRQGKEDAHRFPEREGRPSRVRPPGPRLWIHAASIGEAVSTLALIDRLPGGPSASRGSAPRARSRWAISNRRRRLCRWTKSPSALLTP